MAGKRVWSTEERRKAAESQKASRARAKLEIFKPSAVKQAKLNIVQMLDSKDDDDRWRASTFIIEQMYGKAAAKPLEKPSKPQDDKLHKLIGQVMAKPTVSETDDDSAKPN